MKIEKAVILIRFAVGAVFLSEGIQKFLFPDTLGVGRFIKIGIPAPEIMAPFVGSFEMVCGFLVLIGLWTRMVSIPLLIVISVAIATTKIPMLAQEGFWAAAHEARTDYAMFLGLLFLLIAGGGEYSLTHWMKKNGNKPGVSGRPPSEAAGTRPRSVR